MTHMPVPPSIDSEQRAEPIGAQLQPFGKMEPGGAFDVVLGIHETLALSSLYCFNPLRLTAPRAH
jgi:hypothetical protein